MIHVFIDGNDRAGAEHWKDILRIIALHDYAVVRIRIMAFMPCGCSIHKIDAGLCDEYEPGARDIAVICE